MMNVRILSSTNDAIKKYIGEIRNMFIQNNQLCLEKLDKPGWGITTSRILEQTREGDILTVKTLNSIYELEVVEED